MRQQSRRSSESDRIRSSTISLLRATRSTTFRACAKTAAQLLRRFGTLEGIYENVPAMKTSKARGDGSTAAKLERDVENAGMSKRLATVSIEAPVEVSL